jgi:hypothetical protein
VENIFCPVQILNSQLCETALKRSKRIHRKGEGGRGVSYNVDQRYNSCLLFSVRYFTRLSVASFTCAVGAGDGLFSRLVNSGEVGVGAACLTSEGTSVLSSPITCKNYQMEWNMINNRRLYDLFSSPSAVGQMSRGYNGLHTNLGLKTSKCRTLVIKSIGK